MNFEHKCLQHIRLNVIISMYRFIVEKYNSCCRRQGTIYKFQLQGCGILSV